MQTVPSLRDCALGQSVGREAEAVLGPEGEAGYSTDAMRGKIWTEKAKELEVCACFEMGGGAEAMNFRARRERQEL